MLNEDEFEFRDRESVNKVRGAVPMITAISACVILFSLLKMSSEPDPLAVHIGAGGTLGDEETLCFGSRDLCNQAAESQGEKLESPVAIEVTLSDSNPPRPDLETTFDGSRSLSDEEQLVAPFGVGIDARPLEQQLQSSRPPPPLKDGEYTLEETEAFLLARDNRSRYLSAMEIGELPESERQIFQSKVAENYEMLHSGLVDALEDAFGGELRALRSDPPSMVEIELALSEIAQDAAADSMLWGQRIQSYEFEDRQNGVEMSEQFMLQILNPN